MESSLYFKTALIVSIQIGIIFIGCYFFIKKARDAYSHNRPFLVFTLEERKIVGAS